jgi:hypothetical protein
VVAVAPGAAAAPDGPSGDGTLESLFDGGGDAGERVRSAGRARSGAPEARTTTIDLSAAADPVPRRRGVVPIRHIVGARPPSGRWLARARRSVRVGVWVAAAATVAAGLLALWVLLFTTVSGGDVWLGRPLAPTRHDENATQPQNAGPGGAGTASVRPGPTAVPPKPSTAATKASNAPVPTDTSGKGGGGSSTATSGSGGSGRNGADDPPVDDSGGTRSTASTSGGGSGSGSSGSGSGSGSGSSGSGSGSSGGSGGHGSDD